jgi:hypothetical protein
MNPILRLWGATVDPANYGVLFSAFFLLVCVRR